MTVPPVARSLLITAVGLLLGLVGAAPALAEVTPEYFNLPAGHEATYGISAAADGSVWFAASTGDNSPAIGRLDPAAAVPGTSNGISTFPTTASPKCCEWVRSVAADSANDRVWFSQNNGVVGYAQPAAVSQGTTNGIKTTQLGGHQDLWDMAVAPGGLAWFTEHSGENKAPYYGNRIASIQQDLGVSESENFSEQGPTRDEERYYSGPAGITTDASGRPWFAEESANTIAESNGLNGYTEYPIQPEGPNYEPTGVAVAKDGSIWFTSKGTNQVGRLDPAKKTFTNYNLTDIDSGLTGGAPRAISVAADGTMWVAEWGSISHPQANAIIRIVPSQSAPTATVYRLGKGFAPIGVAPDTKGNVWFSLATEVSPSVVGRLAGVVSTAPPTQETTGTTTSTSTTTSTTTNTTTATAEKPLTPATMGVARVGSPRASHGSVTVNQKCVGPPSNPCELVYLLSTGEYTYGFPGARASAARRKVKAVVLARKAVTLYGGQQRKVTVTLGAAGKRLLKRKGKLVLYFTATQAGGHGVAAKVLERTKITLRYKH